MSFNQESFWSIMFFVGIGILMFGLFFAFDIFGYIPGLIYTLVGGWLMFHGLWVLVWKDAHM